MIAYMPFTILHDDQYMELVDVFDHLTLFTPADALVPDSMRTWEQQGKLRIESPAGIDTDQLVAAIANYKAWADLHQGDISDMAAFFKTHKGRIPMMDETNPSQIGHQIRHYGESLRDEGEDPLFKSALFLAMAQEYDIHQHAMAKDMHSVQAMEQRMLEQLSGGGAVGGMELPDTGGYLQGAKDQRIDDPDMNSRRIAAWSRLVLAGKQLPLLFLTFNRSVVQYLHDLFPGAVELANQKTDPSHLDKTIRNLASDPQVQNQALTGDSEDNGPKGDNPLTIYGLPGISPFEFLSRLAGPDLSGGDPVHQSRMPINTLIGWMKSR